MKLALVVSMVMVPMVPSNVNGKTSHFAAKDGLVIERQKNGDVTLSREGKLVAFIGASNVAYGVPLEE